MKLKTKTKKIIWNIDTRPGDTIESLLEELTRPKLAFAMSTH